MMLQNESFLTNNILAIIYNPRFAINSHIWFL